MTNYTQAMAKAAEAYAAAIQRAHEDFGDEVEAPQPPVPEPAPPETEQQPRFNAGAFYDSIRQSLFGGSLSQSQVDGHSILGKACGIFRLDPFITQSAYVLATAYHETAKTMQPIEEYGGPSTRYAPWYGRGFVR
jgi:hypothetical protein